MDLSFEMLSSRLVSHTSFRLFCLVYTLLEEIEMFQFRIVQSKNVQLAMC